MGREVQSSIIEKSVTVLDLLAHTNGRMTHREIVDATGFNKSSAHRILAILVGQGLVEFDDRNRFYSLGPKLVSWARAAWQKTDLSLIDDEDLAELCEASGMNIAVSVLSDPTVTFIRTRLAHPYKLAVKTGGQSELHCTAAGKVFLAFHQDKTFADRFIGTNDLDTFTENTITDPKALKKEIEMTRNRGYAISEGEEFYRVVGIAAPIYDYDQRLMAAMSIWVPLKVASLDELISHAPRLLEKAAQISARFGMMS